MAVFTVPIERDVESKVLPSIELARNEISITITPAVRPLLQHSTGNRLANAHAQYTSGEAGLTIELTSLLSWLFHKGYLEKRSVWTRLQSGHYILSCWNVLAKSHGSDHRSEWGLCSWQINPKVAAIYYPVCLGHVTPLEQTPWEI